MLTENTPVVGYGPWDGGYAMFERRCPKCGRLVKADEKSNAAEAYPGLEIRHNATCSRCGRVRMPFQGWIEGDEDDG